MNHPEASFISIARITKTQGLKGAVRIELLVEDDRIFESGRRLILATKDCKRETEIEFFRRHHRRCIIKLRGIDHISEAGKWTGAEIKIPGSELSPPEGWFYTFQLKGCSVLTEGGDFIGDVTDVLDSGGSVVLKIDRGNEETLIPFAQSYMKKIDLDQRRIEVELPEELRKLNK